MATRAEKAAATAAHTLALEPVIEKLAAAGITGLAGIARALNIAGHPALQGGKWRPTQVDFLLQRLGIALKPSTLSTKSASTARRLAEVRALADARARIIAEIREGGVTSFAEIARRMNARGITTRDGNVWDGMQVRRIVLRLGIH
jgi:hypothetical protein